MRYVRSQKSNSVRRLGLIASTALLLMFAASSSGAQVAEQEKGEAEQKKEEQKSYLYKWTDDNGTAHIADNPAKVPEKYRSRAERLEAASGEGEEQGQQGVAPQTRPSQEYDNEADGKEEWRQRVAYARQRLADAQFRLQELEKKKAELAEQRGGAASGRLTDADVSARLEEDLLQARKDLDTAKNELEVVIPDDARRAGAPPGWLRE
jgi:hypothetical protein